MRRLRRRVPRRDARRRPAREHARRHVGARQGRLARRAPACGASSSERGQLTLRVWQSIPADLVDAGRGASGCAPGSAARCSGVGYLKVFMDGTLGSQTALDARRQRRADHERRGAGRDRPPRRRGRASRSASTRSATARTAKRSTRSRRRRTSGGHSASATGSSTASCSRPRTCRASRSSASRAPCSSRTRLPTAISPTGSGPG